MRIIVCAKQVPDTSEVKIDPKTNRIIRDGVPSILNPDDANALRYDGGGTGLLQHGTASIDHCVASLPAVVHGVVLRYVYVHQSRALPETEPSYMPHCCGYMDGSERVALGKGVVAYGFQAIRQVGNP